MNRPHLHLLLVLLAITSPAQAHTAVMASANASVSRDGIVRLRMTFDTLAYLLNDSPQRIGNGPMDALLDGPSGEVERQLAGARDRFADSCKVLADGRVVPLDTLLFPSLADVIRWKQSGVEPRLPVMLELSAEAHVPRATRSIAVQFPDVLGQVILTVERPDCEPRTLAMEAGSISPSMSVAFDYEASVSPTPRQPPEPSRLAVAARFAVFGFEHILPRGLDHILFVLGLFLLGSRLRPLLAQVTAFTVAHSLTLALSSYGVMRPPAAVVEPLIAASIAFVAVENLLTSDLKPWRPVVVFLFGLVHGLGFGGVLASAGLPRREVVTALFAFNVGIELAQLAVIAAAFMAVGWFRRRPWYRAAIVVPASVLIAAVGLFWMTQRMTSGPAVVTRGIELSCSR